MNLDDLKDLRRQLDQAISAYEAGMLKDMTELEKINHLTQHGDHAAVIGDFVIRKRMPMPWSQGAVKIPLDR